MPHHSRRPLTTRNVLFGIAAFVMLAWFLTQLPSFESAPPSRDPPNGVSGGAPYQASVAARGNSTNGQDPSVKASPSESMEEAIRRLRADDSRGRMELYFLMQNCRDVAHTSLEGAFAVFKKEIGESELSKQREDAFRMLKRPCLPLSGRLASFSEGDRLLREAADLGEPRAASILLARGGLSQSPATRRRLAEIALTGLDPQALLHLATGLQARGIYLLDGKQIPESDHASFYLAWLSAACSLGAPCDAQSTWVLDLCARRGLCGATGLPESISRMSISDAERHAIENYRQRLIAAVDARALRGLGLDIEYLAGAEVHQRQSSGQ